jgi:two-component system sensor histidine kinase BaeS
VLADSAGLARCNAATITSYSAGSQRATVTALNAAIRRCLGRQGRGPAEVDQDFRITGPRDDPEVRQCVLDSRRQQLEPYVAPPALLYIGSPDVAPAPLVSVSRHTVWRIVLVTSLVLTMAMLLTTLVGLRLVRPLRGLLHAVRHPTGNARAVVGTRDEIGSLAIAFNDLSDRRERVAAQRKAMISDIAHELRTPLSNVRGWLQAAEDGLIPRDPALTSSLLEEALQLQHIIDDLQDLALADAGELHLQCEDVDLTALIGVITQAHRGAANLAGVRLDTTATAGLRVPADPTRLRQVIGNLLANALRHTPADGSITVRATADDGWARIEVTDTGTGIGEDALPYVFDRFWRAERSRNRVDGGSGLGLAIGRQLIEAHHGTLSVTSELDRGSTFTIMLPHVRVDAGHRQ